MICVLSSKLHSRIGDQEAEIGPGQVWHAPPNVEHITTALEDSIAVSVKDVIKGHGRRLLG
jgi:quercetin dioxygenase-like cupin family protein